jgi:hypothetical protein
MEYPQAAEKNTPVCRTCNTMETPGYCHLPVAAHAVLLADLQLLSNQQKQNGKRKS